MILREIIVIGPINKLNQLTILARPKFHTPGVFSIDQLARYALFVVEQAVKRIEAQGLSKEMSCIYDRTGMTNQSRDFLKLGLKVAPLFQEFYGDRMGNFFVIGATTAFWIGKKILTSFLSKKTNESMKLIYKLEELLPYFDKDVLFDFHGGNKKFVYDPHEMWGLPKDGEEENASEVGE